MSSQLPFSINRYSVREGMHIFSMGEATPTQRKGFYLSRCNAVITVFIVLLVIAFAFLGAYYYATKSAKLTGEKGNFVSNLSPITSDFRGNVNPVHYRLQFFPYLNSTGPTGKKNFTLYGQAKIFFRIYQKINTIEFHSSNLNIEKNALSLHAIGLSTVGEIMSPSNTWTKDFPKNESNAFRLFKVKEIDCNEVSEICSIKLSEYVNRNLGILMLTINYWTSIKQDQAGIFYQYYHDLYNQKKSWYVATKLNPSYARRVFPCFDLPHYNSTFDISILRHKTLRALSNSEVRISEALKDQEWVWDHFQRTRGLSISNVGFIVMDAAVVKVDDSKIPVAFWSMPSEASQTSFIAHVAPKMLEIMNNITSVSCPLSKLDIVILPGLSDTAGSWSLIFMDATEVLPYRRTRADLFEFRASKALAEPIAHQWFLAFGNPIWAKAWMASALQLYLTQTLIQNLNSAWKVWNYFLATSKPMVMHIDSYNLLPVLNSVNYKELSIKCNSHCQMKGALLFLMFLGPDGSIRHGNDSVFTSYLSCSISRNRENCKPWQILTSLNLPSNFTFQQAISPWVKRSGFPIIEIERDNAEHFSLNQDSISRDGNTFWHIPVDYMTSDLNVTKKQLLYQNKEVIKVSTPENSNSSSWIIINSNGHGYFRANYSNWSSLQQNLMFGNLSDIISDTGKAQLIDDAFGLAYMGQIPYSVPLNLTHYLSLSEVDFPPWSVALYHLSYIEMFLWDSSAYAYFRIYMLNLLNPIYEALKLDVIDFHLISELRNLIVNKMCLLGLPQCNDWAKVVFETFMNQVNVPSMARNSSKFPDSMKYIVYCTSVTNGGKENFLRLRELYFSSNTSRKSQALIAKCLTCSSSRQLIHRILDDTLAQDEYGYIMTEIDAVNVWKHSSVKPQATDAVFEHFRMNWNRIYERFHYNPESLQDIVFSVSSSLTRPVHITDLTLLHNHWKNLTNTDELFINSIEIVSKNCEWRRKFLSEIEDLFFELAKSTGKARS